MSELFPIDQVENDRLLLEAVQRKRDLIDYAVKKYAPHLLNKTDVKVLHLYSTNDSLRKQIRAFCGGKTVLVEHVLAGKAIPKGIRNVVEYDALRLPIPKQADLVVTKTALTKKIEWLAARLNATPVVLPEATDYLVARLGKQWMLTVVGADQA
jgi:hypothetical protein